MGLQFPTAVPPRDELQRLTLEISNATDRRRAEETGSAPIDLEAEEAQEQADRDILSHWEFQTMLLMAQPHFPSDPGTAAQDSYRPLWPLPDSLEVTVATAVEGDQEEPSPSDPEGVEVSNECAPVPPLAVVAAVHERPSDPVDSENAVPVAQVRVVPSEDTADGGSGVEDAVSNGGADVDASSVNFVLGYCFLDSIPPPAMSLCSSDAQGYGGTNLKTCPIAQKAAAHYQSRLSLSQEAAASGEYRAPVSSRTTHESLSGTALMGEGDQVTSYFIPPSLWLYTKTPPLCKSLRRPCPSRAGNVGCALMAGRGWTQSLQYAMQVMSSWRLISAVWPLFLDFYNSTSGLTSLMDASFYGSCESAALRLAIAWAVMVLCLFFFTFGYGMNTA